MAAGMVTALGLLGGCGGEYDNQLKQGKEKWCAAIAAEAALTKLRSEKPDDVVKIDLAKEEVATQKRYVKIHADLSGDFGRFMKEVEATQCP